VIFRFGWFLNWIHIPRDLAQWRYILVKHCYVIWQFLHENLNVSSVFSSLICIQKVLGSNPIHDLLSCPWLLQIVVHQVNASTFDIFRLIIHSSNKISPKSEHHAVETYRGCGSKAPCFLRLDKMAVSQYYGLVALSPSLWHSFNRSLHMFRSHFE
jgi:hypothetical protein